MESSGNFNAITRMLAKLALFLYFFIFKKTLENPKSAILAVKDPWIFFSLFLPDIGVLNFFKRDFEVKTLYCLKKSSDPFPARLCSCSYGCHYPSWPWYD